MDLSIIIVNYNTKDLTARTINSLISCLNLKENLSLKYEIILVDNGSLDQSKEIFQKWTKELPFFKYIYNNENFGFGKANNIGVKNAKGKYILFLNSDVIVNNVNFSDLLKKMNEDTKIGALTIKISLNDKEIDWASHRGFPSLWNSFTYYSGLEKMTKNVPLLNKVFGGYHLTSKELDQEHEIDSPTGAFYLSRKEFIDAIQGFDEDYFMYGEDLDMSLRLKKLGLKIIYYPKYSVLHLKNQSGIKSNQVKTKSKTHFYFYDSMKIFFKKHYAKKYPNFLNELVYKIIDFKSKL